MPAESETVDLRAAIRRACRADEAGTVAELLREATLDDAIVSRIGSQARRLIETARAQGRRAGGLDSFLHEYDLSSQEGVVMLCLAEALLRVPDSGTMDVLIRDVLGRADWQRHLGQHDSLLVNAATWTLLLTGRLLQPAEAAGLQPVLQRLLAHGSEPIIREAMRQGLRLVGRHFVMAETMEEALARAHEFEGRGYRISYDRLGEAALTAADARRYCEGYAETIAALAALGARGATAGSGVSVKLSALHPRFEQAQVARLRRELAPRLRELALQAKRASVQLTVDAEESEHLEPTLELFEAVFHDPALSGWEGFGLAVQAYQKRAPAVIEWLAQLARAHKRRLPVRLVKGAYWDSEIKRAQEQGLAYPVFTRKVYTDLSYLACTRRLLCHGEWCPPQFATHNAYTAATVMALAPPKLDYEFQCLYGMGEALHGQLLAAGLPVRIYAPVGDLRSLLPYLVRRLLENGANTSFVNRLQDEQAPVETLLQDPVTVAGELKGASHPRIPLPRDLYRPERANARGLDLGDDDSLRALQVAIENLPHMRAVPLIDGREWRQGATRPVTDPADRRRIVGEVCEADEPAVAAALETAAKGAHDWDGTQVEARAAILLRAADLLEFDLEKLVALLVREGGKTLPAAVAEVREAVDYCRYYAAQAVRALQPESLPGPTGERNTLHYHGRGVMACISPWNFPLAIFTGQVVAALAAGNTVIAKPAGPTPLVATATVRLLLEAGIPPGALQLLPGRGNVVGAPLLRDPRLAGVLFTGSAETAKGLQRALAAREGAIIPLIAETGGVNAMIVDSTALPEQVVTDALRSAFDSAGQRCSALRVLFLQEEIAPVVLEMLAGAMAELRVGDPGRIETDVGPVIDENARSALQRHVERMEREARLIARAPLAPETAQGSFIAPCAIEIESLGQLPGEVFGPILHVIRYPADALDDVIQAINASKYGLTFGLQSRIEARARQVAEQVRAGNIYVNRNMIGAVVGVQSFGGEGLSGTGPKAGGPNYLRRLCVERTVSVNTTASGGNASLLALGEDE